MTPTGTQNLRWLLAALAVSAGSLHAQAAQPNILWIISEDHGPQLGCYGDSFAATPHVDALAARGVIYTHVWSCAPVCAPARTTLISGLYPTATGSEHMRSMVRFPERKQMFPQLLREAGYYCTNNAKEDYNLTQPGKVWDESSRQAHWRNRPARKPFFAVFNSSKSHEGQVRVRPHKFVHDPAAVRVPAYHPDTPEVRHDWAQYYDAVTEADADAGVRLRELDDAGLAEQTIVFYFADHGAGMPRSKRCAYNSGLHVPLVVYIPEAFRELRPAYHEAGGKIDRLVSFVDFAPTVLSLAQIKPPDWMHGHAFLGPFAAEPRAFNFGFRGRMDERYDLVRSVTDGRYVYVRNFHPHRPLGQHVSFMFQMPTTRVWHALHEQGKLDLVQDAFWQPKAPEELYDLSADPDETNNLAGSPAHRGDLERFREALGRWLREFRDLGFLPEGELVARSGSEAPLDALSDDSRYPFERIYAAAHDASTFGRESTAAVIEHCQDADSAVRYWGVLGLLMRGPAGDEAGRERLQAAIDDSSVYVRIAAAEALARFGDDAEQERARSVLLAAGDWGRSDVWTSMTALNAIDALGANGAPLKEMLRARRSQGNIPHARYAEYVPRLLNTLESK